MSSSLRAAAAAIVVTTASFAIAQSGPRGARHDFAAERLVAPPTTSWPTNGGNLYNQRYSPLKAINRANVAQLKGVWRARLRGSGTAPQYSGFAQPLVYDGVAYVSTGANDVFALSIDTGEILWQYAANLDPNITSVCCGWNNKGVAISEDKVFIGPARRPARGARSRDRQGGVVDPGRALAGELLDHRRRRSTCDGMVIIGFAGGDRGTRSRLKAYDAKDGRLIWTFYTIPGPGEPGHETWPKDNDAWKYGGAAIWQTPAVDLELGLVYFSTGNAAPDYNGAFRAGDNLYAASMLAIELATGKYRWHFQQVHHDIWDYDAVNPVVLMDVNVGGPHAQGDRRSGEDRLGLHPRSRDRQAAHRHRREAGAAGAAAGDRGDAAVPARRRRSCRSSSRSRRKDTRSSTTAASSRRSSARTRRSWRPASGAAPAGRRAPTTPCSSGCSSARRR